MILSEKQLFKCIGGFFLLITLLIFMSCGRKIRSESGTEAMFTVDTNLLMLPFYDAGDFTVGVPKQWIAVDSSQKNQIANGLSSLAGGVPKLYNAWLSLSDSSALLMNYYANVPTDWIKNLSTQTQNTFNSGHDWVNVQYAQFIHHQKDFHQVVLQNKQIVVFRVFMKGNRLNDYYELNYIIHRRFYDRIIQSVESSIGSIQFNLSNNKK